MTMLSVDERKKKRRNSLTWRACKYSALGQHSHGKDECIHPVLLAPPAQFGLFPSPEPGLSLCQEQFSHCGALLLFLLLRPESFHASPLPGHWAHLSLHYQLLHWPISGVPSSLLPPPPSFSSPSLILTLPSFSSPSLILIPPSFSSPSLTLVPPSFFSSSFLPSPPFSSSFLSPVSSFY